MLDFVGRRFVILDASGRRLRHWNRLGFLARASRAQASARPFSDAYESGSTDADRQHASLQRKFLDVIGDNL